MASIERSLVPIDVIEEIFCKIPIEYLTQFKLTCKQWLALLQEKRFISKYLDLVQERFIRIDHMVQIIDPVNGNRSSSPIPEEFHDISEISTLVHCDGLLLCRCNNTRSRNCKLAVWNPFLKRIKWIKPMDFYSGSDFYGIGYDNVSRDEYKILRIFDGELDDESEIIGSCEPEIQIFDFKSDSWRVVDDTCLGWSIDPPCKGVSVKGNMYWVAHWNNKPEIFIQSFDFSTEKFKLICDIPFQCSVLDTAALSCFRGDRLSLLHQSGETKKIEVWVTNKLNNDVVSWTKYLNVTSPDLPNLHTDQDLAHPSYFIDKTIVSWYGVRKRLRMKQMMMFALAFTRLVNMVLLRNKLSQDVAICVAMIGFLFAATSTFQVLFRFQNKSWSNLRLVVSECFIFLNESLLLYDKF